MDNVYEPMWYLLCHYRLFIVFFFLCISNPPGYKNSRVFKWILSGPALPHSIYLCMEVLGFNGKIQSAKFSDDPQRRVGNDFGSFFGGPWHGKNPIWLVWVVWVVWVVAFCQCSPNLSGLSPGWVLIVSPFFCVRMWVFPKVKANCNESFLGGGGSSTKMCSYMRLVRLPMDYH